MGRVCAAAAVVSCPHFAQVDLSVRFGSPRPKSSDMWRPRPVGYCIDWHSTSIDLSYRP